MRTLVCVAALCMASFCMAPIYQHPPPGYVPKHEATDQELGQAQAAAKSMGEVGDPEYKPSSLNQAPAPSSDMSGAAALSQTAKEMADAQAKRNLVQADRDIHTQKSPARYVWLVLGSLGVGLGGAWGFRTWANKALPAPPTRRRRTNW